MAAYDPEEAAHIVSDAFLKADATERRARWNLSRVAEAFARKDVVRAAEWADAFPAETRVFAVAEVAKTWAATDPHAALEWLALHPARDSSDSGIPLPRRVDAAAEAVAIWLRSDEKSARGWIESLPAGETHDATEARLIQYLTQNQRVDQAAVLCTNSVSANSGFLAARIVDELGRNDPLSAARWAADLPADRGQTQAVAAAVYRWATVDPQAAASWITQFPDGDIRDRAITAYVQTTVGADRGRGG
jgi:hypothetical protein